MKGNDLQQEAANELFEEKKRVMKNAMNTYLVQIEKKERELKKLYTLYQEVLDADVQDAFEFGVGGNWK